MFIYLRTLTQYRIKYFAFILKAALLIFAIINFISPYGITFASVSGLTRSGIMYGRIIYEPVTIVSRWMIAAVIYLSGLLVYAVLAMKHFTEISNKKDSRVITYFVVFGMSALMVHNAFVLFSIKGFYFIQYFGIIAFTAIIAYKNMVSLLTSAQLNQDLKESQERLKKLSDSSIEGILFFENARIVDANSQLLAMFGYTKEETIGKEVYDFLDPESITILNNSIEKQLVDPFTLTCTKKDGTRFPIRIKVRTMDIERKTFRVAYVQDLTENY